MNIFPCNSEELRTIILWMILHASNRNYKVLRVKWADADPNSKLCFITLHPTIEES
jgi:hypothetical protein